MTVGSIWAPCQNRSSPDAFYLAEALTGAANIPISRLVDLWDRIRSSYWFIPTLMLVAAIGLAVGAVRLDVYFVSRSQDHLPWFGDMGAEAARKILATIAGTMVTVAGVVFSITIVALQLASSQFGPRLLRNFMVDLGNQIVLGTFISTFVYCLLVLASVRGASGDSGFVPSIATAVGLFLGVASIGVLIFFIHHVAGQIRIENVVARIAAEVDGSVSSLFPETVASESDEAQACRQVPEDFDGRARSVGSDRGGYVRYLDGDALMRAAEHRGLILRIERRPGDFVTSGMVLLSAWPGDKVDDDAAGVLRRCFAIGSDRTPIQDVKYSLQQLTQLALRALSPALNDPHTAVQCIHRLTEGLREAARRYRPSPYRFDDRGKLRVIAPRDTLMPLVIYALDPLVRAGSGNSDTLAAVIAAAAIIGKAARYDDDRDHLAEFARSIRDEAMPGLTRHRDRQVLQQAYADCKRHLDRSPSAVFAPASR